MANIPICSSRWFDGGLRQVYRLAASGWLPADWFRDPIPEERQRKPSPVVPTLEIVSHCWMYSRFLAYQLSSLVNFPPTRLAVTMTVYHAREDADTAGLLEYFGGLAVPGIRWQWRVLPKEQLFRRAIGRNEAALASPADWVWFTDCDVLFREKCLDALAAALEGRRDVLVFPRTERITPLLSDADPLLRGDAAASPRLRDIGNQLFTVRELTRATGPMQITHGDVARAGGYCRRLRAYQTPANNWCKATEDRAFRWLLGTQGQGLDIPGVYRIRHESKGRYAGNSSSAGLRAAIRRLGFHSKKR